MQNFLPYADFDKSAQCLNSKRLVKQNLETRQCLAALCGFSVGWRNHPAVTSWENCIRALVYYGLAINAECVKRGFKNSEQAYLPFLDYCNQNNIPEKYPDWLGDEKIHSSHRSRLLCKGFIDVLCDGIKKHFKIKKIDDWCKREFGLTKNQLKYEHVEKLSKIIYDNGISYKVNHYDKFGWKDDPRLPYVWPTKEIDKKA